MTFCTKENMAIKGEKKKEWQRDYQRKNRAKVNASSRDWRNDNTLKARAIQRRADFKKKYGITIEEYEVMLVEQDGCCAICLLHQMNFKNRLAVDHDHQTGKIRALLCGPCNTALGLMDENTEVLIRAIKYIETYANKR